MDRDAFIDILKQEGFADITTVTREPGVMDVHEHPFEAKALILDGDILLTCGGAERRYEVGDVFHLPAGTPHAERYGANGVQYLVGRK
ncbi:cupin domain-containing protein [Paraburkholderia phosphatilytica]|uniref:cupin domain-containing protein n=1 Tax=Paraburkholderia phosphatilytica TaxID=2282883 RepID=UPI000E4A0993|nr:cupin domain-containing protein [Paraburkholderia phosphatilytica]